jgi:hypothetical protein
MLDMPGEEADADAPRFVRRKVFAIVPRLCPSCLNPLQSVSELGGWLVPYDYFCPNCRYRGHAYLEADPEKRPD